LNHRRGCLTHSASGAIGLKHSRWGEVLRGVMPFAKTNQGIRPLINRFLKNWGCGGVSLLHCLSVPLGGIEGV